MLLIQDYVLLMCCCTSLNAFFCYQNPFESLSLNAEQQWKNEKANAHGRVNLNEEYDDLNMMSI